MMKWGSTLLICVPLCAALPSSIRQRQPETSSYQESSNSIKLKRLSHFADDSLKRQESADFLNNYKGLYYSLPVKVGTQDLYFHADTGSNDLWTVAPNYRCWRKGSPDTRVYTGELKQETCDFSTAYKPDSDFKPVEDSYLVSSYGAGGVNGDYGSAPITFAGINVQAYVGLAYNTTLPNSGPPVMSGLFGLPYSNTTDYHDGSGKVKKFETALSLLYRANPAQQRYFSLALSRDDSGSGDGGTFTLGGLPNLADPSVNVSSDKYTASKVHTAWDPNIEGFTVGDKLFNKEYRVLVDTGGSALWVPSDVKAAVDSLWVPKIGTNGKLDCNAQLSSPVGVNLGGTVYYMEARDLIWRDSNGCSSGVFTMGDMPTLGLPFLKNVLAVFDQGRSQFAVFPRQYYKS